MLGNEDHGLEKSVSTSPAANPSLITASSFDYGYGAQWKAPIRSGATVSALLCSRCRRVRIAVEIGPCPPGQAPPRGLCRPRLATRQDLKCEPSFRLYSISHLAEFPTLILILAVCIPTLKEQGICSSMREHSRIEHIAN